MGMQREHEYSVCLLRFPAAYWLSVIECITTHYLKHTKTFKISKEVLTSFLRFCSTGNDNAPLLGLKIIRPIIDEGVSGK